MLKRIYRLLGLMIGVAAMIAFVGYTIKTLTIADISHYLTGPALAGILLAALLYATIIPVSAWAWKSMLADTGYPRSWHELSMIMGLTQMAKYLPGNVGQHIGRAAMSMTRGIAIQPFLLSVFSETLLALLAALIIGTAGAFFHERALPVYVYTPDHFHSGAGRVVNHCAIALSSTGTALAQTVFSCLR